LTFTSDRFVSFQRAVTYTTRDENEVEVVEFQFRFTGWSVVSRAWMGKARRGENEEKLAGLRSCWS